MSDVLSEKKRILRQKLRRAEDKAREAEDDQDRASDKNLLEKQKVAELAEEVAELEINYWEEEEDYLDEELETQQSLVMLFKTRLEREKAGLVNKNNLAGSDQINLDDFDAQVADYAEDAKEKREELRPQARMGLDCRPQRHFFADVVKSCVFPS